VDEQAVVGVCNLLGLPRFHSLLRFDFCFVFSIPPDMHQPLTLFARHCFHRAARTALYARVALAPLYVTCWRLRCRKTFAAIRLSGYTSSFGFGAFVALICSADCHYHKRVRAAQDGCERVPFLFFCVAGGNG